MMGEERAAQRGIAIVAVLALVAAVSMLLLSYSTLAAVNWLSARNLRENLYAWSRAEAAIAVVVSELQETYRRNASLPDSYALVDAEALGATVAYARSDPATAEIVIVARFGKAAVRRTVRVDMSV